MRLHLPLVLATLCPGALAQTTWFVDVAGSAPGNGSAGNPYTSIQFAIDQASTLSGDTLSVAPGTYFESVDFIGKDLALVSQQGAQVTTLDGGGASRCVRLTTLEGPFTRIEGFTLRNGGAVRGAGIWMIGSELTLVDSIVLDCTADEGGGIHAVDADLSIEGSTIADCRASRGGGLDATNSILMISGCDFDANRAAGDDFPTVVQARGGGMRLSGCTATIDATSFTDNVALFEGFPGSPRGGGIHAEGATSLSLSDCVFDGNVAGDDFDQWVSGSGGGAFVTCDCTSVVDGCQFLNNVAGGIPAYGGGYCGQGTISSCTFSGNRCGSGGALSSGNFEVGGTCSLVVEASSFLNNSAHWDYLGGGAVLGPAELTSCLLEGNTSSTTGGAARDCTLTGCVVRDNEVSVFDPGHVAAGGGLSDCTAIRCTIEGNGAFDFGSFPTTSEGGGVFGGTAIECTIRDNQSGRPGVQLGIGGGASNATLEHCLVFDNLADHGGGASWSTLTRCTLYRNRARIDGGGVGTDFVGAQSTLRDSIVWGNVPSAVVPGGNFDATYSDIEGGAPGVGNFDADPLFWMPLSADLHLKPGSPCIDTGNPASPPDSDGSIADVGAHRFRPAWNPAPGNYCDALAHSGGCIATMGSIGRPTLGGSDDFVLTVQDVIPLTPGIFIWSRTSAEAPFMNATLCLGNPIVRMPVVVTSGFGQPCSGTASQPLTQAAMAAAGLVPYETIHAQFWYRDPSTLPFGIGLSDGLEITVRP